MFRNQSVISFGVGLVFSLGLGLSGMTLPQNIIAFLNLKAWNPALIVVMMGATAVFAVGMRLVVQRGKPILGEKFEIPTGRKITWQLVTGAILFGVGWGLGGFCGGPALASLAMLRTEVIVFVVAMFVGMFACQKFVNK